MMGPMMMMMIEKRNKKIVGGEKMGQNNRISNKKNSGK